MEEMPYYRTNVDKIPYELYEDFLKLSPDKKEVQKILLNDNLSKSIEKHKDLMLDYIINRKIALLVKGAMKNPFKSLYVKIADAFLIFFEESYPQFLSHFNFYPADIPIGIFAISPYWAKYDIDSDTFIGKGEKFYMTLFDYYSVRSETINDAEKLRGFLSQTFDLMIECSLWDVAKSASDIGKKNAILISLGEYKHSGQRHMLEALVFELKIRKLIYELYTPGYYQTPDPQINNMIQSFTDLLAGYMLLAPFKTPELTILIYRYVFTKSFEYALACKLYGETDLKFNVRDLNENYKLEMLDSKYEKTVFATLSIGPLLARTGEIFIHKKLNSKREDFNFPKELIGSIRHIALLGQAYFQTVEADL